MPKLNLSTSYEHKLQASIKLLIGSCEASNSAPTETNIEAYDALMSLKSELRSHQKALDKAIASAYTKEGIALKVYNKALTKFANACESSINKYENDIIVAPGRWNHFKAAVQNFFGSKKTFKESQFVQSNPDAIAAFLKIKGEVNSIKPKSNKEVPKKNEAPTPS